MTIENLQFIIGQWADKQFPNSTDHSIITHLKKEIEELQKTPNIKEAVDCLMILLHLAHKHSWNLRDVVLKKLTINKRRKWGKPDKDGVIEHIREQRSKSV